MCDCDDLGIPVGPKGDTGGKGDKGDKGDTGDTGGTGATGAAGENGEGYDLTSSTSVSLPAGATESFVVSEDALVSAYKVGARVRVSDPANPVTNYLEGILTAYSGTNFTVAVDYTTSVATTVNSWNINIAGESGASSVTPELILALDVSAVEKQCATPYILGDTLQDYLQGIIQYACSIGGGSSPSYDTQITYFGELTVASANLDNGNLQSDSVATIRTNFLAVTGGTTEGVDIFTVPAGVSLVQFEIFGGGGEITTNYYFSGFIMKNDATNYFYTLQSDVGSVTAALTNSGGASNCPFTVIGNPGGTYQDVTNDGSALGGSAANLGYNYGLSTGTGGAAPFAKTGGAGGSYGRVTLGVTAGDIFYIYTNKSATPDNTSSKVIVSYNA